MLCLFPQIRRRGNIQIRKRASYITFLGLVVQVELQLKQEFRAIRTSLLREHTGF